jgi:hypothetical protein
VLNVERLQPCEYGVTDPATGMAKECGEPASWRFGWSEPGFPDSIQLCEGHARKVRHDYQSGNYPDLAGR